MDRRWKRRAAALLAAAGISCSVLDMYCIKPLDTESVLRAAKNAHVVVTAEEHSPYGGLGSMVSALVAANCPRRVISFALPDEPVITGTSGEVFAHYGLNGPGIAAAVRGALEDKE